MHADLEYIKEHLSECTWLGKVDKIEKHSDESNVIHIHFSELYDTSDLAFAFRNYPEKSPSLYIMPNRDQPYVACEFWLK